MKPDILKKISGIATYVFLSALLVAITFYFRDGYTLIATRKYEAFLLICGLGLPVLAVLFLLLYFALGKKERKRRFGFSTTDILLLCFLGVLLLSCASSDYGEQAWLGADGWFMGARTYLLCFFLYFFTSRLLPESPSLYPVMLAVSGIAFLWGFLDRLGIHPLEMTFAYYTIVGPIGNVNWFAGYFSLFFPLGFFLFFLEKHPATRVCCLIHAAISTAFGLYEGSDSAYLPMLLTAVMLYLFLTEPLRERRNKLRLLPIFLALGTVAVVLGMIAVNTIRPGSLGALSERQFFRFDSRWGTFRGADWRTAILAFLLMPFGKKWIGIGPDCFGVFVYSVPELTRYLDLFFSGSILDNAHSEPLNILVTIGIFGTVTFYGAALSAPYRAHKLTHGDPELTMLSTSVLCYLFHNLVSFASIVSTPFFFLMLGMLEHRIRFLRQQA